LENPPLWVWAIVVGAIIASKFVYRWQVTKQFAKEDQERGRRRNINSDQKTKDLGNNDLYDNINRRYQSNIRSHKYSPSRFYKDYFAIKMKKRKV
jgi:type II secretory pathway pseudopilin PulG